MYPHPKYGHMVDGIPRTAEMVRQANERLDAIDRATAEAEARWAAVKYVPPQDWRDLLERIAAVSAILAYLLVFVVLPIYFLFF